MPVRDAVRDATNGIVSLEACEGEQWDGQDASGPAGPSHCPGPSSQLRPDAFLLALCGGPDPNPGSGSDPLNPTRARVSSAGLREAYASGHVVFVGRVAVYAGTCAAGEDGLEGSAACSGTRELRTGLYVRDDTPGNMLTHVATCWSSVICRPPQETDCSHEAYMHGAMTGQQLCARDNTAFGVMVILP